MQPSVSELSKSSASTAADNEANDKLRNAKTTKLDSIFPLIDEMFKKTNVPKIFYQIVLLVGSLQMIAASLWHGFPEMRKFNSWGSIVVKYFASICYFTDVENPEKSCKIQIIVLLCIAFLAIFLFAVQAAVFSKTLSVSPYALYPTMVILEASPPVVIVPIAFSAGTFLSIAASTESNEHWAFMALSLVAFITYTAIQYVFSYFRGVSVYISTQPTAMWDCWVYFSPMVICGLSIFLSFMLSHFNPVLQFALIALKVFFNVTIIYELFFFPIYHFELNSVFAGVFTALTSTDIVAVIRLAGVSVPDGAFLLVFVAVAAISSPPFIIIFIRRRKAVLRNLRSSALEDVEIPDDFVPVVEATKAKSFMCTDAARVQHFTNCGISRNQRIARMYLRIGVANHSDLLLDFSVVKFVAQSWESSRMRLECCRVSIFFPCEHFLSAFLLRRLETTKRLTFHERFFCFQANKVKNVRQSASSREVTEKHFQLKQKMSAGVAHVCRFWRDIPNDVNDFYALRSFTLRTSAMYREAIANWPNNVRVCEDYATFLIECGTNFTEGLFMKHRAELIELGQNFVVDLSFRSLVRRFPSYLKRGVMTPSGRLIAPGPKGGAGKSLSQSQSSSTSRQSLSQNFRNGVLDQEVEDELGKSSFRYSKLRVAMQRALSGKRAKHSTFTKAVQTWTLFAVFVVGFVLFFVFYNTFDSRIGLVKRQFLITKFRYGYDAALATAIIFYARERRFITDGLWKQITAPMETTNYNLIFSDNNNSIAEQINRWVTVARNNFVLYNDALIAASLSGTNVTYGMIIMTWPITPIYRCKDDEPITEPELTDFRSLFIQSIMSIRYLILEVENIAKWHLSPHICILLKNFEGVINGAQNLSNSLQLTCNDLTVATHRKNVILMASTIACFVLTTLPLLIYSYVASFGDLRRVVEMMRAVNQTDRDEATRPIKKDVTINTENAQDIDQSATIAVGSFVFVLIASVVMGVAMPLGVYFLNEQTNDDLIAMNMWEMYGPGRTNYLLESILALNLGLMISNYDFTVKAVSFDDMSSSTKRALDRLSSFNNYALRGHEGLRGCVGQSEELDRLNIGVICQKANGDVLHDSYRCSSIDKFVALYASLGTQIISDPTSYFFVRNGNWFHCFHIANAHMVDIMYEAGQSLVFLASHILSQYQGMLSGIVFGVMALNVAIYIAFWVIYRRLDDAFDGALQLIRRLPPMCITTNPKLMAFITNKKVDRKADKMSVSQSVIHKSRNAVLCLSRGATIDVMNQAVTDLFGYTPEQILGQYISILFPEDSCKNMYDTMEMMRNGESSLCTTMPVVGVSDSDVQITISATVIGISEPQSPTAASSFALVLRDETMNLEFKQKAEKAKEQSEKLLYQILPRDIVSRINAGETDITIVVPCASIIFIDIVKFSDYAASLTPSQIMENLSTIFANFDRAASSYPMITKIKLIGDVYMAAGGLFSPDEPPKSHAEQVVKFGLDTLVALEEANTQLESSLQVRIGVNTDGPIIAGVLGTDKPMFDIIGDPINVAARLQSTCIPNSVQISHTTFEAIHDLAFNIESRGEIELKGKGKKKAYVVRSIFTGSMVGTFSSEASN